MDDKGIIEELNSLGVLDIRFNSERKASDEDYRTMIDTLKEIDSRWTDEKIEEISKSGKIYIS